MNKRSNMITIKSRKLRMKNNTKSQKIPIKRIQSKEKA
jgi:hypothetical protein